MAIRTLPETLQLIERIDTLIRHRATGTPDDMAEKLEVSRSTWFNYLHILKEDLGFPIDYDPEKQTYFYTARGAFRIGYTIDPDL
jgi:ACT domain-containing protein